MKNGSIYYGNRNQIVRQKITIELETLRKFTKKIMSICEKPMSTSEVGLDINYFKQTVLYKEAERLVEEK